MLPPDALTKLKSAVANYDAQIQNIEDEIARAQRAGIDVTSLNTRLATLKETVRKIKLQYPEVAS